jgi:hypothetical protein
MEYHELFNEYTSLLQEKNECRNSLFSLKEGYISTKTISGKQYAYLQYRVNGKLLSEYVKDENLHEVRAELERRTAIVGRIHEIEERLNKIEAAANILDSDLRRKLVVLRRCDAMEAMPIEERKKSLAFSSAMIALKDIQVSAETENNLSRWAAGNFSFQESYINTLRAYSLVETKR